MGAGYFRALRKMDPALHLGKAGFGQQPLEQVTSLEKVGSISSIPGLFETGW